jgi:hypothetical protein
MDTLPICGYALTPGHFSTRIATVITSDFRIFDNLEPVYYLSNDGTLYQIPKNATSDLASIPRELWSLLPPAGTTGAEYALAAFGHDSAYRNTLLLWNGSAWVLATLEKPDCDLLLREMMIACQVPEDVVDTIYEAVRLGGAGSFKDDRA